jgi:hypothetical protein
LSASTCEANGGTIISAGRDAYLQRLMPRALELNFATRDRLPEIHLNDGVQIGPAKGASLSASAPKSEEVSEIKIEVLLLKWSGTGGATLPPLSIGASLLWIKASTK